MVGWLAARGPNVCIGNGLNDEAVTGKGINTKIKAVIRQTGESRN